mmetsp:Transcript_11463/g.24551  ORF Transcript_11463/g.24551 Transcript_11463/m.24551 type:complete len:243 (-) Transcript_11463:523-1251(-)
MPLQAMLNCLFFSVLAVSAITSAAVAAPIPVGGMDGFKHGAPDAPIQLEVFIDLACPDCKAAWPVLKKVVALYGAGTMRLTVHLFPLPYHTWAFHLAQSVLAVASASSTLLPWIDMLFDHQDDFSGSLPLNSSYVVAQLEKLAVSSKLVSAGVLKDGMANQTLNANARISWKYGCTRGVSGTPAFLVNGVAVDADPRWTLAKWKALLDPVRGPSMGIGRVPYIETARTGNTGYGQGHLTVFS